MLWQKGRLHFKNGKCREVYLEMKKRQENCRRVLEEETGY